MAKVVRMLSDIICFKHELSIIDKPKRHGKSYNSWLGEKEHAEYAKLQKEVREMLLHNQNYEYILGIEMDKNEKDDRTRNIEK